MAWKIQKIPPDPKFRLMDRFDGPLDLRELPKNNLRILLALFPVFYVVITGT